MYIFKIVDTTRHIPKDILKIIDPVIEKYAYFVHPENMLLAMAVDERLYIAELTYKSIAS